MILPKESYNKDLLADLDNAVEAAKKMIAIENPELTDGLGDIALTANETFEQQKTNEQLDHPMQKLHIFVSQIFASIADENYKKELIANFESNFQFNVESNEIVFFDSKGDLQTEMDLSKSQLKGEITVPKELRIFNLILEGNEITNISELPYSLRSLDCSNNEITGIPNLPIYLENLNCSINQLTKLPMLVSSLESLLCYSNNLTSIPELPEKLNYLDCSNNKITKLPDLTENLINLHCKNNGLTELPKLPNKLESLYCSDNKLTKMPKIPDSLESLVCISNKLTHLDIPRRRDLFVYCGNNPLTKMTKLSLRLMDNVTF